jgi:hypothetical protein
VLARLALPCAGAGVFFLVSLATVRLLRPREPRRFFLIYAILLLVAASLVYAPRWPLDRPENALGLVACLLVQAVLCLTMWNSFYSLLWGFSGGLSYDLWNHEDMRHVDRLIRVYEGEGEVDRMLARRLPNLVRGGYIEVVERDGGTLRLLSKGRAIARGTLAAFKLFSLGMGGGIK